METVWERRRLKRETLEPEDMHTVRGGGISALARLGPWDLPDISEALSPHASLAHLATGPDILAIRISQLFI